MERGGGKRKERGYEIIRKECALVASNFAHFDSILHGVKEFTTDEVKVHRRYIAAAIGDTVRADQLFPGTPAVTQALYRNPAHITDVEEKSVEITAKTIMRAVMNPLSILDLETNLFMAFTFVIPALWRIKDKNRVFEEHGSATMRMSLEAIAMIGKSTKPQVCLDSLQQHFRLPHVVDGSIKEWIKFEKTKANDLMRGLDVNFGGTRAPSRLTRTTAFAADLSDAVISISDETYHHLAHAFSRFVHLHKVQARMELDEALNYKIYDEEMYQKVSEAVTVTRVVSSKVAKRIAQDVDEIIFAPEADEDYDDHYEISSHWGKKKKKDTKKKDNDADADHSNDDEDDSSPSRKPNGSTRKAGEEGSTRPVVKRGRKEDVVENANEKTKRSKKEKPEEELTETPHGPNRRRSRSRRSIPIETAVEDNAHQNHRSHSPVANCKPAAETASILKPHLVSEKREKKKQDPPNVGLLVVKKADENVEDAQQQWAKKLEEEEDDKRRKEAEERRALFMRTFPVHTEEPPAATLRSGRLYMTPADTPMDCGSLENEERMSEAAIIPTWQKRPEEDSEQGLNETNVIENCFEEHKKRMTNWQLKWQERETYAYNVAWKICPKNFCAIADHLPEKSTRQCVQFYYMTKLDNPALKICHRAFQKKEERQKKGKGYRPPIMPNSCDVASIKASVGQDSSDRLPI